MHTQRQKHTHTHIFAQRQTHTHTHTHTHARAERERERETHTHTHTHTHTLAIRKSQLASPNRAKLGLASRPHALTHAKGSTPWVDVRLSCESWPCQGSASGHGSPWELGWDRTLEPPMVDNSLGLSSVWTMGLHSWNIWWCITNRIQEMGAYSSLAAIIHATPWVRWELCSSLATHRLRMWCKKVTAHWLGQPCCSKITHTNKKQTVTQTVTHTLTHAQTHKHTNTQTGCAFLLMNESPPGKGLLCYDSSFQAGISPWNDLLCSDSSFWAEICNVLQRTQTKLQEACRGRASYHPPTNYCHQNYFLK